RVFGGVSGTCAAGDSARAASTPWLRIAPGRKTVHASTPTAVQALASAMSGKPAMILRPLTMFPSPSSVARSPISRAGDHVCEPFGRLRFCPDVRLFLVGLLAGNVAEVGAVPAECCSECR